MIRTTENPGRDPPQRTTTETAQSSRLNQDPGRQTTHKSNAASNVTKMLYLYLGRVQNKTKDRTKDSPRDIVPRETKHEKRPICTPGNGQKQPRKMKKYINIVSKKHPGRTASASTVPGTPKRGRNGSGGVFSDIFFYFLILISPFTLPLSRLISSFSSTL